MQTKESQPDNQGQYLSFTLGGEDYGVDILKVQEIKGWEDVRPLPESPPYIKGVLDLRGTIVPIIDLRSRFNLAQVAYTPTTVIIVLAVETEEHQLVMGVVVDSVSDVLDTKAEEVKPAPNLGTRINTRYIEGMINREGRMVILLDVDRLLSPEEMGDIENQCG